MTSSLEAVLTKIVADLDALRKRFALVGGLAVSARVEPRFTRDLDLAVAVEDDRAAEKLVHDLQGRGYEVLAIVEQEATHRLATVRLSSSPGEAEGIVVDLLFASSGIETEIAAGAERVEVFPGLSVPIAQTSHLVALKILSRSPRRPQDEVDLVALLSVAGPADIERARAALVSITERGFHRGRDLMGQLDRLLAGAAG